MMAMLINAVHLWIPNLLVLLLWKKKTKKKKKLQKLRMLQKKRLGKNLKRRNSQEEARKNLSK